MRESLSFPQTVGGLKVPEREMEEALLKGARSPSRTLHLEEIRDSKNECLPFRSPFKSSKHNFCLC